MKSRFIGSMLGLAIGDALGSHFEGQDASWIGRRYADPDSLISSPPQSPWNYTDDTQMAIGVAEALVADGCIQEPTLRSAFVNNYVPSRGYGRGARVILEAMTAQKDYVGLANTTFPGGSFGNGAAMRVAPVGLLFHADPIMVVQQAKAQSVLTHTHPAGIHGATLIATAVAHCLTRKSFDRDALLDTLLSLQLDDEYIERLRSARAATTFAELATLGNGIAAIDSTVTAIACFAMTPDSFGTVIANAILLGGDTDTIAAMAGAISGAFLGVEKIPGSLISSLEDERKGRSYIVKLAEQLFSVFEERIQ